MHLSDISIIGKNFNLLAALEEMSTDQILRYFGLAGLDLKEMDIGL